MHQGLIDERTLGRARAELGANFVRILGYFKEDGVKSLITRSIFSRSNNRNAS